MIETEAPITTWQQGAAAALSELWFVTGSVPPSSVWLDAVDEAIPPVSYHLILTADKYWLRQQFQMVGFLTIANNGMLKYDEVLDTLAKKQADYGHGNISRHGLVGIIVRLCDKVERLKNLKRNSTAPNWEAVEDTATDIVGYCVIALMLLDDTFKLELA